MDQAGLFVGHKLEQNHEATFFLDLNRWVLSNAGAAWDRPLPILDLLAHEEAADTVVDYLDCSLASLRTREFLGRRVLGARDPRRLSEPWGWKDPRNTATLPFWLRLFPDARVLVVDRHGVDVAASLHTRFMKGWPSNRASYYRHRPMYRFRASRHPVARSQRVATLSGAFDVWRDFQEVSVTTTAGLGDRLMRFRYEDLLADADGVLPGILSFCGLEGAPPGLTDGINANRAFAYRRKPELVDLARSRADELARWGYEA